METEITQFIAEALSLVWDQINAIKKQVSDLVDTVQQVKKAEGPVGKNGIDGEKGDVGAAGKDGANGKDGRDGRDGHNGTDGTDGRDGKDGSNGINGKDGQNGKDGSPDTPDQVVSKLISSSLSIPMSKIEGMADIERIAKANAFNPNIGVSQTDLQGIKNRVSTLEKAPASSSSLNPQTPGGTVNGVNASFTYTGVISMLFIDGTFQLPTQYTASAGTLTVTNIPYSSIYAL